MEWIEYDVVLAIQEAQLAEHGGLGGIRDEGMLWSALARPHNLFTDCPECSLYQLAAAYTIGIGRNHAFIDGNKRIAWVVCALLLELNGISVIADQADVVQLMFGVADGTATEEGLAFWLQRSDVTRKQELR